MTKMIKLVFFLLISFSLSSQGEQELILDGEYSVFGTSNIAVGMSFPPFSHAKQIDFTINELNKLAINRIRIAIDWRNREPEKGSFYWDPMDLRMSRAKENGLSVFLTIGSICPDWARLSSGKDGACLIDENALQNFIEEVLLRYDCIDKIQFGNEWEFGKDDETAYMDSESIKKFVHYNNILYEAVQKLSPDTEVVLGGLTRMYPMVEYFAKKGSYPDFSGIKPANGAGVEYLKSRIDKMKTEYVRMGIKQNIDYVFEHAEYDILDIHLYDDPENWPEYLSVLPRNKAILVSEFGGPNSEFEETSPSYQAVRMQFYIDAVEKLPVIEAYYFKLVESDSSYHKDSGLFFSNLKMKPARNVFARRLTPLY